MATLSCKLEIMTEQTRKKSDLGFHSLILPKKGKEKMDHYLYLLMSKE